MIIRTKQQTGFTILKNSTLRDSRMSLKAHGLLDYMLSMDEGWQFYTEELSKHFTDGITSIRTALKELEENGYLVRKSNRNANGNFNGNDWLLYDEPQAQNPRVGNPISVNPISGNRTLRSTNNKNYQNKEEPTEAAAEIKKSVDQKKNQGPKRTPQEAYFECYGKSPNALQARDMFELSTKVSPELINYAIKQAANNGAQWNYAKAIIKRLIASNVKTVDEITEPKQKSESKPTANVISTGISDIIVELRSAGKSSQEIADEIEFDYGKKLTAQEVENYGK